MIEFDYRFDTNGFFADPARRRVLEAAANIWESFIEDEFPNVPTGIQFSVSHPQTGQPESVVLNSAIDDVLIFVGASPSPFGLGSEVNARGGFDGVDATGSTFHVRYRGSNFEPWVGKISFNTSPLFSNGIPGSWFFDLTPNTANDVPLGSLDFLSTAVHEIGHVLGIGTAPIFKEIGAGAIFDGSNTMNVNNGLPVALEGDLAHVQGGFLSDGRPVIMAGSNPGGRWTPTRVDLAMLTDIGYQIVGYQPQGATPTIATEGNDTIFGTIVADIINGLGGNDQIQDSFANDTLIGGFGNDNLWGGNGRDTFIFEPFSGVDSINDFVVAEDTIQVSAAYGFSSSSQLLGRITNSGGMGSGGFFSELSLSAGNTITIFHDSLLTEVNFTVV